MTKSSKKFTLSGTTRLEASQAQRGARPSDTGGRGERWGYTFDVFLTFIAKLVVELAMKIFFH